MKLITIGFKDSVDISVLPKGTAPVSVSDGTNTLSNGEVVALIDLADSKVKNHSHEAEIGPPVQST